MKTISDYITSIHTSLDNADQAAYEAGIANEAPTVEQGMILVELDDLADRLDQMMMHLTQEKK